jgi:ubiquitin related modifier 1
VVSVVRNSLCKSTGPAAGVLFLTLFLLQFYSIVLLVRLYHTLSSGNHITTDFPTHKVMSTETNTISLKIEFGGGLELLFSSQRSHRVTIPSTVPVDNNTSLTKGAAASATRPADVTYLLHHLRDHLLKERQELFMENGTVCVDSSLVFLAESDMVINRRPGILVLINDTDWELEGEGEYLLKDGDEIVLISTLHGG